MTGLVDQACSFQGGAATDTPGGYLTESDSENANPPWLAPVPRHLPPASPAGSQPPPAIAPLPVYTWGVQG